VEEKFKSSQQKLTFLGFCFAEKMKKETPSFSANLTVGLSVYLKKKKNL